MGRHLIDVMKLDLLELAKKKAERAGVEPTLVLPPKHYEYLESVGIIKDGMMGHSKVLKSADATADHD